MVTKIRRRSATAAALLAMGVASLAKPGFAATGDAYSTFDPDPNGHIYSTAVQPDGKHVAGGLHATIGGSSTQAHISRLLAGATHSMDSGFVPPVLASGDNVYCSAVLPDGKILIGGNFSFVLGSITWNRLVRLNADGTLDFSFVVPATGVPPNPNLPVNAICVQKDGKILIGGQFTTVSGGSRTRIARLNADASLDTTFISPSPGAEVWSLALTDDEKIVVGGAFVNVGGTTKDYAVLLGRYGAVQAGFTADANAVVNSVAVQADGKIILGGNFTTVNGSGRARIARVDGTTGVVDSFNPSLTTTNGNVFTSVVQADQKIIAGGAFVTPYNRIARFDTSGAADSTFNPNVSSTSAIVYGLALHKDGTVLAGGSFTTIDSQSHTNLALLENDSATEGLSVTDDATRVEWLRGGTTPDATQVIFEKLYGSVWIPLAGPTGAGKRIGTTSDWEITGVSLPQNTTTTIRARARVPGGRANGSSGLVTVQTSYYSTYTPGLQPDIAVELPTGSWVTDDFSTESFGTVYYAAGVTIAPRVRTFIIRNTGAATLTDLFIPPLTGTHAADYTVSALSATTLAPNETATFTVSFRPGAVGTRTANLQIDSNVTGNRSPFSFGLTGAGSSTAFDVVYGSADEVGITAATFTGASKTLTLGLDHVPQPGANLSVVEITGLAFITSPFTNVAHGDTVTLSYNGVSYEYIADYYGGNGNDFELVWKFGRPAAFGSNHGSYGAGTITARMLPWPTTFSSQLAGKHVLRIAMGKNHRLAVCSDGSVLAWGANGNGQLGNNSTTDSDTPVLVNTTSGVSALYNKKVVAVAAGMYHSLALCSDGTLVSWGSNTYGVLGNNNYPNDSHVPSLVNKTSGVSALYGKAVVGIGAGFHSSVALCSDGTVATWGNNDVGQIGDNTSVHRHVPTAVNRAAGSALYPSRTVLAISAGESHCLAVRSDGVVVAWGYNYNGQLGDTTTSVRRVPVLVNATSGSALYDSVTALPKVVSAISAGSNHSLALCEDGSIASWGYNQYGELGDGTTSPSPYIKTTPTTVNAASGSALYEKTVVDIAAYDDFSVALCSDGTAASWGSNDLRGRLGNNDPLRANKSTPSSLSRLALCSEEYFGRLAKGPISTMGFILTRGKSAAAFVIPTVPDEGIAFLNGGSFQVGSGNGFTVVNTGTENLSISGFTLEMWGGHGSHIIDPDPVPYPDPAVILPGGSVYIHLNDNPAYMGSSDTPMLIHHSLGTFEMDLN